MSYDGPHSRGSSGNEKDERTRMKTHMGIQPNTTSITYLTTIYSTLSKVYGKEGHPLTVVSLTNFQETQVHFQFIKYKKPNLFLVLLQKIPGLLADRYCILNIILKVVSRSNPLNSI